MPDNYQASFWDSQAPLLGSNATFLGLQATFLGYHAYLLEFKGMVHLIYKLYLKAVFLCVKFNGPIGFSEKCLFLT